MVLVFVLVSLAGVVGVSGMVMLSRRLPDPSVADRDALVRWIVCRDLSGEEPALRRVLAQRLDEEFGQPQAIDWGKVSQQLKPSHRQRLATNIPLLLEPWMEIKMRQFYALASSQRAGYLDRTLDTISQWRAAYAIGLPVGESGEASHQDLFQRLNAWKQQAEPVQREQIEQFLFAVQTRWLRRTFLGARSANALER